MKNFKLIILSLILLNISNIVYSQNIQKLSSISGILKVIDGDTIKINNQNIRLMCIDAPEKKQLCFNGDACGKLTTEKLKEIIDNQIVTCDVYSKDKYNRLVGICYTSEFNLNYSMLKIGYAMYYPYNKKNQEICNKAVLKDIDIKSYQYNYELPSNYRKRIKRK